MIGLKHGWKVVSKDLKANYICRSIKMLRSSFTVLMIVMSCCVLGVESDDETFEDEDVIAQQVKSEDVCVDEEVKCIDDKRNRKVNNLAVSRECWKYEYVKSCNKVQSKKDCNKIPLETFNFKKEDCLTTTKIGVQDFCLNVKKTFVNSYKETEVIDKSELKIDPDDKEAVKDLLCEAFCLDGNCSEAYKATQEDNNEIASAVAQLEMLSNLRKGLVDEKGIKFDIFGAQVKRCHNKTLHSNCCKDSGMLKSMGLVKCNVEQKSLASEVRKGKCLPIGEYCAKKILGKCLRKTKSYCCFPTILAKTIRLAAKDQLGKGFGTAKNPQCGGLTLNDIENLDFSKIDFHEFFEREVQPMIRPYSSEQNENFVRKSFPNLKQEEAGSNSSIQLFQNLSEDGINRKLFKDEDKEER